MSITKNLFAEFVHAGVVPMYEEFDCYDLVLSYLVWGAFLCGVLRITSTLTSTKQKKSSNSNNFKVNFQYKTLLIDGGGPAGIQLHQGHPVFSR